MKEFEIPYTGLKEGKHHFSFEVNNTFFEAFEYSEIHKGSLTANVDLEKQSNMLVLHFDIVGTITIPCDRCMEDVSVPVQAAERLIVKFGDEPYEETDEIFVLPPSEHKVNVAQPIFEFVELNMPQKRLHAEGKCNSQMIEKLSEYAVREEEKTDPRWKALEELKKN